MGKGEQAQRVGHVDVVDPYTVGATKAHRGSTSQAHKSGCFSIKRKSSIVPRAVTQQRKAEIEAPGERYLSPFASRHLAAILVQNFHVKLRLQKYVAVCHRIEHSNRSNFIERINIEHGAVEAGCKSIS